MATANPTVDVPAYAPPMARPGYGKISAPGQAPRTRTDFAHLPAREASIAAHLDRLPEGAAMDAKTLAKELPNYGQQAVRTALNNLSTAGHLRRVRQPSGPDSTQWVTRTHFSRTARDSAWWAAYLAGDVPAEATTPVPQAPVRQHRAPRERAFAVLADLGRTDHRMTLSAAECRALEPLAAQWLARGVTEAQLTYALTAGLPTPVHSPGAFARKRLTDKLPPETVRTPQATTTPLRIMECTGCAAPGRPEALPGGLCRTCRGAAPTNQPDDSPRTADFATLVGDLRSAIRTRRADSKRLPAEA